MRLIIKILHNIILFLIECIEKYEYRNISLDEDDINKKILNTININEDLKVMTDTGWKPITHIHLTQPYKIWKIVTLDGLYLECADNHRVFDRHFNEIFVKDLNIGSFIKTINGDSEIYSIEVLNYSLSMFDLSVDSNEHRFYTNGILSHNTICSSIYIAWYLVFNSDRNALILSNKGSTTQEIIDKAKTIFTNLPFFLKPGIIKNDVFSMRFDNGCRLIGQNTTKKAGIGFTIHLLFLDEFAHVHETIVDSFYENVFPTLSSSKVSRIIITSTPNGYNKFYEIYNTAEKGKNEFSPFKVDWWQVPGRNKNWMVKEIHNLGSLEAFNRQYGNSFVEASSLLLSPTSIAKLETRITKYIHHDFPDLDDIEVDYKDLLWDPSFDTDETYEDDNYWIFSVDFGEGGGGDYSVLNIFKIEMIPMKDWEKIISPNSVIDFFRLKQVGRYKSNKINIEDFAKIVYTILYKLFNFENVKMVLEYNIFGSEFIKDLGRVFPNNNQFDEENIVKYKHRMDAKTSKFGFKHTGGNKVGKNITCLKFKKYIAMDKIYINEYETIEEAKKFTRLPGGNYGAQRGNDDLIMSSVNAGTIFDTLDFADFTEELFDLLDENYQTSINKILDNLSGSDGNLNYDIYDTLE